MGYFLNMLLVHNMWINSVVNIAENFKRRLDKFAIEFKTKKSSGLRLVTRRFLAIRILMIEIQDIIYKFCSAFRDLEKGHGYLPQACHAHTPLQIFCSSYPPTPSTKSGNNNQVPS